MVKFTETAFSKSDHFFVKEDAARIYRGLRDILVTEFDIDRIEEGKMEFNVSKPKDRIRMHAFKEKSPHTVIHYNISWKAKEPRDIYKYDRPDDILKARVETTGTVVTVYPGRDPSIWTPQPITQYPQERISNTNLEAHEKSRFQRSKLYEILVGIWYHKFYSKEIHRYEEEAEETILHLHDIMREKFGVEKSIGRSGASHYLPPWR